MKLGIKIAPGNDWTRDIEATHPAFVEIWYDPSCPADYDGIFSYLRKNKIDAGLHFWGTAYGFMANTSYPDPKISRASMALIQSTINTAARHNLSYVNMHPDLYALLKVNLETLVIRVASAPADPVHMEETFVAHAQELSDYAASKNVLLTVETVPMRDTRSWKPDRDRTQVYDIHQPNPRMYQKLASSRVAIANDIGHVVCDCISDDRGRVLRYLFQTTKTLAPATKLIHLGFIVPPYNGVDFHDTLENPILSTTQAIPNTSEMIELLKIFKDRDDVRILVEPRENHVKNFFLAREILRQIRG